MYLKHFYLDKYPFDLTPDTEFSCNYRSHQEALNVLLFCIGNGEWIIKIVGEVGFGKTFLCRELLNYLDESFVVVYISNPDLSVIELKRTILRELQNQMPVDMIAEVDITQLIVEQLLYYYRHGKRVIIVIDEAQVLSDEGLETLRLFTNIETESKKLLQIVLFAQPELKQRLAHHSLRQLNQRITFSYELAALDREEFDKYIAQRLIVAGHIDGSLFSRAARRLLYHVSKGTPRLINILAHKAMLAAYGKGMFQINRWAVKQAIRDSKDVIDYNDQGYWSWSKIALFSLLVVTGMVTVGAVILFLIDHRIFHEFIK